jgi:hypothetical protein
MNVDRSLGGISLEADGGEQVALESLWSDGPVVIAWVRHFG